PHAQPRPSARGAKNSQPSVEFALDPRSTLEFCVRVTRPRLLTPSEESLPGHEHKSLRCGFDDHRSHREMELGWRATKRQRTRRDWLHQLAQQQDRQRCKLLPFDDETQRCGREYFRDDNYRLPNAHRACRKGESLAAKRFAKTAAL